MAAPKNKREFSANASAAQRMAKYHAECLKIDREPKTDLAGLQNALVAAIQLMADGDYTETVYRLVDLLGDVSSSGARFCWNAYREMPAVTSKNRGADSLVVQIGDAVKEAEAEGFDLRDERGNLSRSKVSEALSLPCWVKWPMNSDEQKEIFNAALHLFWLCEAENYQER